MSELSEAQAHVLSTLRGGVSQLPDTMYGAEVYTMLECAANGWLWPEDGRIHITGGGLAILVDYEKEGTDDGER